MSVSKRFETAPPANLIPGDLAKLAEEINDLRTQANQAAAEIGRLSSNQLDHHALEADRAEVGTQVRAGNTPKSLTPNADKLAEQRAAAALVRERTEAARLSVNTEAAEWLAAHGEDLTEHTAQQAEAAAGNYRDALAALEVARRDWHIAAEAHRWATQAVDTRSARVSYIDPTGRMDATTLRAVRAEVAKA